MDDDLREDLEIACMDAIRGDPPSRTLAGRLERAVLELLMRRGIRGARVTATSDRRGTSVTILLPKPDNTVEQVILTLS